jgi:hypothetical protein
VSLSGSRLPIGEYSSVEAFQHTVHHRFGGISIHFLLVGVYIKGAIEVKVVDFWLVGLVISILLNHNTFAVVEFVDGASTQAFLAFIEWSETNDDTNVSTGLLVLSVLHISYNVRYMGRSSLTQTITPSTISVSPKCEKSI